MKIKNILLIILLLISASIFAQAEKSAGLTVEEINEITSKLSMKLLLKDSQMNSIENILKTYNSELRKLNSGETETNHKNRESLIESVDAQIVSVLDSKQKMKYDVLKRDWWETIGEEEKD